MRPGRPTYRRARGRHRVIPRSTILFFVGLGLMIYEATGRGSAAPRGALVAAYILMMGLPIAEASDLFRNRVIDTWDRDRRNGDAEPDDPPVDERKR